MLALKSLLTRCQRPTIVHHSMSLQLKNYHKQPVPVAWEKPEIGWTKLNFDGSSKGKAGRASIGGVVRNHKAEFLLGYAESIGRASSTIAELSALRRGLELVLENGWSDVWLEGDAKALVEIIANRREVRCAEVRRHVSHINAIIPELNGCVVSHVYREGNRTAVKFAKMGHFLKKPQVWVEPPHEVLRFVLEDAEGKIIFRRRR